MASFRSPVGLRDLLHFRLNASVVKCSVTFLPSTAGGQDSRNKSITATAAGGVPETLPRPCSRQILPDGVAFRHPRAPTAIPTRVCPAILNLEEMTWYRH